MKEMREGQIGKFQKGVDLAILLTPYFAFTVGLARPDLTPLTNPLAIGLFTTQVINGVRKSLYKKNRKE